MLEFVVKWADDYYVLGYFGLAVGVIWSTVCLQKNGIRFPMALIITTAGTYAAGLGTRILFVLEQNPELFLTDPGRAFAFWAGGLSWLGGLIPLTITGFVMLKLFRKPIWSNLGCNAPGLALSHVVARIACLASGCCYGAPTNVPWAIYSEKLGANVHPTQVYSMLGEFGSFVILQTLWMKKPEYRKYLLPLYVVFLGSHRFVQEFFRGTPAGPELIAGLRFYQSVCLFLIATYGCILLILTGRRWAMAAAGALVTATVLGVVLLRPASDAALYRRRADAGLYLVVTRSVFVEGLRDWVDAREKTGFGVVVGQWNETPAADEIRTWLREQAGEICSYILLVGDCASPLDGAPAWHIPSIEMHPPGEDPAPSGFISDAAYGDLDADGCPDVPVGRLPVHDDVELRAELGKIMRYEQLELSPAWSRAVVWAGASGFDAAILNASQGIVQNLPRWLDLCMILGAPDSAFSGYVPDQPKAFLDEMGGPALFSLIISHGSFRSVDPAEYEGEKVFLCVEDVANAPWDTPLAPVFVLSCNSGDFDMEQAKGPSLAEAFAAGAAGPVAVVASSANTNPLTNYLATLEMLRELDNEPKTVGDFLLGVQRALYKKGDRSFRELVSEDVYGKEFLRATPEADQAKLTARSVLRNQILSYNLLGDPASSFWVPRHTPMTVSAVKNGDAVVSGEDAAAGARLYIDVIDPSHRDASRMTNVSKAARERRFEQANRRPAALATHTIDGVSWKAGFRFPRDYWTDDDSFIRFLIYGDDWPAYDIYDDKAPAQD